MQRDDGILSKGTRFVLFAPARERHNGFTSERIRKKNGESEKSWRLATAGFLGGVYGEASIFSKNIRL
jgi:hypothetical protein